MKNQKSRFTRKLLELSEDVTTEDRKAAARKYNVTTVTISRYLNGDVRDNDKAAKLIQFFSEQISKREQILSI